MKEMSSKEAKKEEAETAAPILMGTGSLMLGYGGGY
jgi:hypothetical protein